MPYIYLILAVFMSASSSIFGKLFNRKNNTQNNATALYNCILMLSVTLGWGILFAVNFSFDVGVLPYSLLFSICYLSCMVGTIQALRYGPAALTSLFNGLSLIVTTIWGFIFWDATLTVPVIIGLVLVIVSIVLCLYSPKKDDKAVSLKWLFYTAIAFFGNAGCSIVQRTQQIRFEGQYGNMLMLFAVGTAAIVSLLLYLKSDKTNAHTIIKTSWWAPFCSGICNLILNLLAMRLVGTDLSPSLIYPVIGVGGLAVVSVFSLFIFREKMHLQQWYGIIVGAAAVVLLSA